MESTKLPLRTWFLAMFLISQDKTGFSSLALMHHLGTSYRTAWLIHHKIMAITDEGHPLRLKVCALASFTREAFTHRASMNLTPGCDGLSCSAGVIDAGCAHSSVVVGSRMLRETPQFTWVNTMLGNLKTFINGGHKAFRFTKYASQYLGAFASRFNSRFELRHLLHTVLGDAATSSPMPERVIRGQVEIHD